MDKLERICEPLDPALFKNKRILLTGGTGMIGRFLMHSYIVTQLEHEMKLNCELHVLSSNPKKFLDEYPAFNQPAIVKMIDTMKPTMFTRYTDIVYGTPTEPEDIFASLLCGYLVPVKRFLLLSSGVVNLDNYTDESYLDIKCQQEFLAECASKFSNTNRDRTPKVMTARIYTVAGYYYPLDKKLALSQFLHDAIHKKEVRFHGKGDSVRGYLMGTDVARYLWTLLAQGENGGVYEVGNLDRVTIKQVAHQVAKSFGVPVVKLKEVNSRRTIYAPTEPCLDLKPSMSSLQAIQKTCEWWKQRNG